MNESEFLFVEKYRPQKIEDCVLSSELKTTFSTFVAQGQVPNLLLSGGPGVGKTTVAKAMLEELNLDYIVINGSLNGNIDTLRNEILQFASTVSLAGGRKYVILDEADYLNPQSTQPALRNFMEEYSNNCGFILTCNLKNRIIDPLQSRCSVIDFNFPKDEKPKLAKGIFDRVTDILTKENVQFEKPVLAEVVQKFFPDFRRVLNEVQRYSATGKIDSGILSISQDFNFDKLLTNLKEKNFTDMRKWVAQNADVDPQTIFRKLYDGASETCKKESIPQLVLHIAEYQYRAAFVADQEVNLAACLTLVMSDCEFE